MDEIQHPHRKTGLPLIDMIIGGCAILISTVSVALGFHQGHVMERMLAASTMPYPVWSTGNATDDGRSEISFTVTNAGLGPAIIETLQLTLNGKPIRDQQELIAATHATLKSTKSTTLEGRILGPKEEVPFFRAPEAGNDWGTLNNDRFRLSVKLCYCSVLDECWTRDFAKPRPVAVQQCEHDETRDWFSLGAPPKK